VAPLDAVARGAWGTSGNGPANPQLLNRYSYVQNNPLKYTDPTGHCSFIGIFNGQCLEEARTILLHPNSTTGDKVTAAAYINFSHALGAVAALLAYTGGVAIAGVVAPAASRGSDIILSAASKSEAREALRKGIEGLSSGQSQKALDILGRGKVDSFSITTMKGGGVQIVAERAGNDGFQRLVYTLDANGKTIGLVQLAYNAAGELVHAHDKIRNVVLK
jgi:hypothetical protein